MSPAARLSKGEFYHGILFNHFRKYYHRYDGSKIPERKTRLSHHANPPGNLRKLRHLHENPAICSCRSPNVHERAVSCLFPVPVLPHHCQGLYPLIIPVHSPGFFLPPALRPGLWYQYPKAPGFPLPETGKLPPGGGGLPVFRQYLPPAAKARQNNPCR